MTLFFGSLITYLAFSAYRRTGAAALRSLAVGFGIVTVGAITGGVVDWFTPMDLLYSVFFQSVLTLVGFAIITYSLYVD
ncbi:MAG: DUF7521 family protein [Halobacteriota archaeon]